MTGRALSALGAIFLCFAVAAPAVAQSPSRQRQKEGVQAPLIFSPRKPAAPALRSAPAIATPLPRVGDLPVDADPAPRMGGLQDRPLGGADCRTACATNYYFCQTQDDGISCSASWTKCLMACPVTSSSQ